VTGLTNHSFLDKFTYCKFDTNNRGQVMENGCLFVPAKSFFKRLKRKTIVTGHYGSGKTEFAISLALKLKHEPKAVIDLDIVNPYFRSREQRKLLESNGISIYGSVYKEEITAELPALSADIRAPLENNECKVIIDSGGNDTGALILNQFTKYFTPGDTTVLVVVNINRPETNSTDGIINHITAIENITNLTVSYIINNTHMLRETTASDITDGYELCEKVSKITKKPILCSCYPEGIVNKDELPALKENLMPLGLYLRPKWLDK